MDKLLSMLGLAARAGKTVSGEEMTVDSIRSGKAGIVIIAGDASDNSRKLFTDKCKYYRVPAYIYGTKESLGRAIGRQERSAIAVEDKGFSEALIKMLD